MGAPVLLNTTANYSCDEGYVMSGGNERVCGLSGGWSGREITCQCELQCVVNLYLGIFIHARYVHFETSE